MIWVRKNLKDCSYVVLLFLFINLALPHKQTLRNSLGTILSDNWQAIDRQVMFFFKIVCMPVLYYTMRPYFQYIYDCYIIEDSCEMTLSEFEGYTNRIDNHYPFFIAYPAIVPFVQMGNHEYPSYLVRFFLLQSGPVWCFFGKFITVALI